MATAKCPKCGNTNFNHDENIKIEERIFRCNECKSKFTLEELKSKCQSQNKIEATLITKKTLKELTKNNKNIRIT